MPMTNTLKTTAYSAAVAGRPRSLRSPQKRSAPQITATIVADTSSIPTGGTEPLVGTVCGTIATTPSDSTPAVTSFTTSDDVAWASRSEGSAATAKRVNPSCRTACRRACSTRRCRGAACRSCRLRLCGPRDARRNRRLHLGTRGTRPRGRDDRAPGHAHRAGRVSEQVQFGPTGRPDGAVRVVLLPSPGLGGGAGARDPRPRGRPLASGAPGRLLRLGPSPRAQQGSRESERPQSGVGAELSKRPACHQPQ